MKQVNWIKVEDRLPQNWFSVIFADIDGNVGEAYYDPTYGEWKAAGDFEILKNITHWCTLPLPPNDEHNPS
jgi:hypothetical protein